MDDGKSIIWRDICRSREGAWIEIAVADLKDMTGACRSREGAWIEIAVVIVQRLTGIRRSREGAWIEITCAVKYIQHVYWSLPRGSVD